MRIDRTKLWRAGSTMLFLLAVACRTTPPATPAVPINQKSLADSVSDLQKAFNTGDCGEVWERAHIAFRTFESKEGWQAECDRLRRSLGHWDRYEGLVESHTSASTHLTGKATFANEEYVVETLWATLEGHPQLLHIRIFGGKRFFLSIPRGQGPAPLVDPPPSYGHRRNT